MKRLSSNFLVLAMLALVLKGAASEQAVPIPAGGTNDWVFLDNGQLRLGIKKTSGAAIAWLSRSASTRNLLNHYDHGRLVQQSYYGDRDGSKWAGKPWRWNPVQGGDWQGRAAKVLELKATATTLETTTLPKHWATGADVPEMTMGQRISLEGNVARVHFTMRYTGQQTHAPADQELPAFFAEPDLSTLVLCDIDQPWTAAPVTRSKPGWPNEGRRMTENWVAYVDDNDFGVGAYVPVTARLTCYRYQVGPSSCSYFAPIKNFAITPGLTFEYDVWLTVGTSAEIREAFRRLKP